MMNEVKGSDHECEQCGAVYEVTYRDFPVRDKGSASCEVCGGLLRRWNGCRDWTFTLKLRPKQS